MLNCGRSKRKSIWDPDELNCGNSRAKSEWIPEPFCECWKSKSRQPRAWKKLNMCNCGEDLDFKEWTWEPQAAGPASAVLVSEDGRQVTFHPFYSSGTALVRGNTPLKRNHHYYWEVKMLTDPYGTDIMVGMGTSKVILDNSQYLSQFKSLLGEDAESYGLSYKGTVQHCSQMSQESAGFCGGSIIGVRVDMWNGTLEFYLNRQSQGISFYNLRRHAELFPMLCSTASQSSFRLVYAASWEASLLVDAARTLASSVANSSWRKVKIPPGLFNSMRRRFWMMMPAEGCVIEDEDEEKPQQMEVADLPHIPPPSMATGTKRRHWEVLS